MRGQLRAHARLQKIRVFEVRRKRFSPPNLPTPSDAGTPPIVDARRGLYSPCALDAGTPRPGSNSRRALFSPKTRTQP